MIERVPCTIRLVRAPKPSMGFYDFDEYERLLEAAKELGPTAHLVVLLGGEAGLRCGEMIGLEWGDVDLVKRQMCIQRSEWRGHVTVPEGRSIAIRAVDGTSRVGAPGPSSSARARECSVWTMARRSRRTSSASTCARPGGKAGVPSQRRASTPSHVLLASGDARRAGTSDSGTGRTSGPDDDAAVHALESAASRARFGCWNSGPLKADPTYERMETFWRRGEPRIAKS